MSISASKSILEFTETLGKKRDVICEEGIVTRFDEPLAVAASTFVVTNTHPCGSLPEYGEWTLREKQETLKGLGKKVLALAEQRAQYLKGIGHECKSCVLDLTPILGHCLSSYNAESPKKKSNVPLAAPVPLDLLPLPRQQIGV